MTAKLSLNGPAVTNGGAYLDAGEEVSVGTSRTAIHPDRAKEMVAAGTAETVAAHKPEPKAGETK